MKCLIPKQKKNNPAGLECPEKRFQGKPKDSRSQKGGIRRSEGAMGDKWLAGCVTFRPKRSFADLQI